MPPVKTIISIEAYQQAIKELKGDVSYWKNEAGGAQQALDSARTALEIQKNKYDDLMAKYLAEKAKNGAVQT